MDTLYSDESFIEQTWNTLQVPVQDQQQAEEEACWVILERERQQQGIVYGVIDLSKEVA